jgi:uncharacterized protein (TIGR02246 family)
MFERYSEKARRAIFFARYEASQFGSSYIETEHLLLGLLREDRALARFVLGSRETIDTIRKEVEAHMPFGPFGEYVSTSVEVPLTTECKHIFTFAADEANNLKHDYVGVEHLFLGILREEKCLAARLLQARGVEIEAIRQRMTQHIPMEERSHDAATEGRIVIREAIAAVLDAWRTRDAKKISNFFEDNGQFWDVQRNLWLGRNDVEKGIGLYFSSREVDAAEERIEDVKFAQQDIAAVTVVWEPNPGLENTRSGNLRLTMVMAETVKGWHVVSASLAETQPSPSV